MRNIYYILTAILFSNIALSQIEGSYIAGMQSTQRITAANPPNETQSEDPGTSSTSPTGSSTQVGITAGSLSVSLSGAANYKVPFNVPPGVNGVEPKIALTYNSQGGNGIAGYGWEISGVSAITRVPSTKFHDGVVDPVDLDNLDRFSLDGQRLVFKAGTTPSYTPGSYNYYETENFSNIKIKAFYANANSPAYFKVEYPDGSFAVYGDVGATSINEWAIKYWENAQGLRVNYNYTLANNKLRISSINYGALGTSTGFNTLDFVYVTRDRAEQEYMAGQSIITDKLLSQVRIKGYSSVAYKNYYLEYYPATSLRYQQLKQVTEKTGDDSLALNPTVFTYGASSSTSINFTSVESGFIGAIDAVTAENVTGDFNGDGKMDMIEYLIVGPDAKRKFKVFTNLSSATLQNDFEVTMPSGTFNHIFPISYLKKDNNLNYQLASSQGFCLSQGNNMKFNVYSYSPQGIVFEYSKNYAASSYPNSNMNGFYSGDFNGDGITDVIARYFNSTFFCNLDRRVPDDNYLPTGSIAGTVASQFKVMDVNGDGKSDFVVIDDYIIRVYTLGVNNTLELLFNYNDADISVSNTKTILFGDYNGDGKMDFIIPRGNSYNEWYKYTATGSTSGNIFVKQTQTYPGFFYSSSDQYNMQHYIATDYDNDGKTDILKMTCSRDAGNYVGFVNLNIYPNKNGTFAQSSGNYYTANSGFNTSFNQFNLPIFLTSDKPNRNLEVGFIKDNGIYLFKSNIDFNNEKLLKTITTGDGVREIISYKNLQQQSVSSCDSPNVYIPSAEIENYPNTDINSSPSFKIVSKLERKTASSYSKKLYTYHGAVFNVEGLGFLGFRSTMQTNWFNEDHQAIYNISKYDMSLRGSNIANFSTFDICNADSSIPSTNFISKTLNTYNIVNGTFEQPLQSNLVYKLKNTKTEQFDGVTGVNSVINSEYDIYNNSTSVTELIKNGSATEKTTVAIKSFDNQPSATPYYIGRVTASTISTTIPSEPTDVYNETYTYQNNLLSKIVKNSNGSVNVTEDIVSEQNTGNITKRTLSAPGLTSRVTDFDYDTTKRFLTKSYSVEHLLTEFIYDLPTGNLKKEINPYLQVTEHIYDKWGSKIETIDYLGNHTTFDHVRATEKEWLKTINPSGNSIEILFDDLGQKIQSKVKLINGDWSYTSYLYDIYGRNIKISEPYLSGENPVYNENKYDEYGRLWQKISFTGRTVTNNYTGLTITTSDGPITKTSIQNSLGQIISLTDSPGGTIVYQYYPDGGLKSSNFGGIITSIEKDSWGRKKKLVDSSAGTFEYTYNHFGEMTQQKSGKGITDYDIDQYGKLHSKTITGQNGDTTSLTATYSYTNGILNSVTGSSGGQNYSMTYTYNANKQLETIAETNPQSSFEKKYRYDAYGRKIKEYHKAQLDGKESARWIKYTYQNGSPYEIIDGGTNENDLSGTVIKRTNAVNARGQITSANSAISPTGANTSEIYDFDAFGRIKKRSFKVTNGTYSSTTPFLLLETNFNQNRGTLTDRNYTSYDVASNATLNVSEVFGYVADRLEVYQNENGTSVTQSYNANGTIASNNLGEYRYDSTKPYQNTYIKFSDPTVQSYYNGRNPQTLTFNAFKSPVTISEQGVEKVDFDYNIFQSRSVMYYGGTQTTKTTRPIRKYYSADGTMEIKKNTATGNLEFITYIGGNGYTAPAALKSDGVATITEANYLYLYRDYLGSIVAITNPSGQVLERRLFDAWGAIKKYSNSSGVTTIPTSSTGMLLDRGYTGHEHLLGVALINMNGRLYDPKIHRFLSADNFVQNPYNTQDYNRYGYVLNNPFMYTDPSGETPCDSCPPGNYSWGDANGNYYGDLVNSLYSTSQDPEVKDWLKGLRIGDWLQKNFSWGSFFKNNANSVANFLGFGKESVNMFYSPASYSFASAGSNSSITSSMSMSPGVGISSIMYTAPPFISQYYAPSMASVLGDLGLRPDAAVNPSISAIQILLSHPAIMREYYYAGSPDPKLGELNIGSTGTGWHGGIRVQAFTDVFAQKIYGGGNITIYQDSFNSWESLAYNLVHELQHRWQWQSGYVQQWNEQTSQAGAFYIGEYYAYKYISNLFGWGYYDPINNPMPIRSAQDNLHGIHPNYILK